MPDDQKNVMQVIGGFIGKLIQIIWQPHSLIGYCLLLPIVLLLSKIFKFTIVRDSRRSTNFFHVPDAPYWLRLIMPGISLGSFVLICNSIYSFDGSIETQTRRTEITKKHEYGHSRQSLLFGPMYLVVVGLPSLFNNIRARIQPAFQVSYYTFYPESWADSLGGVTAEERRWTGFTPSEELK